jgi:hypothetical protein
MTNLVSTISKEHTSSRENVSSTVMTSCRALVALAAAATPSPNTTRMRGEPEEHLVGAPGVDRKNSAGERLAGAKDVGDGRALLDKFASGLVRPDARSWVSLDERRRAPGMPEDRDQDMHGAPCPGYVAVKGLKEARADRLDTPNKLRRSYVSHWPAYDCLRSPPLGALHATAGIAPIGRPSRQNGWQPSQTTMTWLLPSSRFGVPDSLRRRWHPTRPPPPASHACETLVA